MKEYKHDTSQEYDDMVGYVSPENLPNTLGKFLGEDEEYKPVVKPAPKDNEFPEQWQSLYVNFRNEEDYKAFMLAIGDKPMPKLNKVVYKMDGENVGLESFFGG